MAKRLAITTKTLDNLKPAPPGQRYIVQDAFVPGLAVRVTDRGSKSYVMMKRWPNGSRSATARSLGEVGTMTLADARAKARRWLQLIQEGVDPRDVERQAARQARVSSENTFGVVAEDYIKRRLSEQRRGQRSEREIRRELMPVIGDRPIAEISKREIISLVERIKDRGAHATARIALGHLRTIFNFAIDRDLYGIEASPCDRIRAASILGPKSLRQRVLSDKEIHAIWRAAKQLAYPYGTIIRLLFLTGCRRSEVAEAKWSEFDLKAKVFTVPPERFKAGSSHIVPLTDDAMKEILGTPKQTGPFVFSLTSGETPVNSFSRPKARLDEIVANQIGDVGPWNIHDIRRTVRTRLAALRVPDHIAEKVIGHGRRGIQRVYDQHAYVDEMREALAAWSKLLRSIVKG